MAEALPKRPKKTSAEKRNCRSAGSKWRAQTGEAKVARTQQWAATVKQNFLRFMHYHNVEWKDLHGILVSYFQQELRYDIMETAAFLRPSPDEEPGLRDFLRASSAEEVQVDVPPELSLPVAIDISVFLQAPTAVDSQDGAAQLVTGGDTEVQLGSLTRDVEALLRDALPFSAHEWLLHLEGLTSDDVPFNVFGVNVSRFHYNQSGLNPPTAASSSAATSASELRHLGIWGDGDGVGCQPVGSSDDASSSSEVGDVSLPAILFEHRPNRPDPSGQSLAQIQRMRKPSYFDEEGFRWAEGLGKNSSGARVRKRYAQAGYWLANPAEPSLEELKKFTDSRFPNSPVDDVSTEAMASAPDALAKGFGKGLLYRMPVCDAPANCNRHWHGSNLYVIKSVLHSGLQNQVPDNGPPGVYSYTDTRANKAAGYCFYVLSGTGCAWTAFAELAVDPERTQKYSHDQHVTREAGVCLVALWFHGVSQNNFTCEYIWPLWDPALEVPTSDRRVLFSL